MKYRATYYGEQDEMAAPGGAIYRLRPGSPGEVSTQDDALPASRVWFLPDGVACVFEIYEADVQRTD